MRNRVLLFVAGASLIGGLMIGLGIGLSQAKTEIVEKTVEVEKRVEVTPPACLEAMDLAGEAMEVSGQFGDVVSTYFDAQAQAANSGDVSTFISGLTAASEVVNRKVPPLTAEIEALTAPLGVAVSECRAAA